MLVYYSVRRQSGAVVQRRSSYIYICFMSGHATSLLFALMVSSMRELNHVSHCAIKKNTHTN